jgi:predicted nucleotidyltransferase
VTNRRLPHKLTQPFRLEPRLQHLQQFRSSSATLHGRLILNGHEGLKLLLHPQCLGRLVALHPRIQCYRPIRHEVGVCKAAAGLAQLLLPGVRQIQSQASRIPTGTQSLWLLRHHWADWQQRYHLKAIGLFGSVARGEQCPGSDIDICVELDPLTPYALLHLKQELNALLQAPVDVVRLRQRITRRCGSGSNERVWRHDS